MPVSRTLSKQTDNIYSSSETDQPDSSGSGYLYSVEWMVENSQVTLHRFSNPTQLEHTYHLSVEELLSRVAPPDRKYVERMATLLIDGELERCELEFRILDKAGEFRWVYGKGSVQYESPQQVAKIVGLITGIHAKEQLFDSEVPHPPFGEIDALPVGIVQFDLSSGIIETANRAASLIFQLPDRSVRYSFPDIGTADWVSVAERLRRQGQVFSQPLRLPSLDRWILFSGRRGTGDKVTAVVQDITAIQSERISLRKVNAELDNFVYHASHDLRAPLHAILGSLDLLKREDHPEKRAKCVDLIEGSLNRLDTFVTDLLSISRNRQRENPLVPINFMVEVEAAVAGAYHLGNTHNLEIITKVSQPYPFVADRARVRVVLNNLIANAIKYRRYDVRRSHIAVEVWIDKKLAHLKISDNGEGIAEDQIDRIFDMFYRASERSEGSGLGLYIVKDIVQKLDGSISVRSKLGKSTSFSVRIPNHYQSTK